MKIKEFKIPFNGDYFFWIDVEQPTQEKIEELAKQYNLYKIDTEDCQVPPQIPKLVEHYGYLFLVIEYPLYLIEEKETQFEELDIFVGKIAPDGIIQLRFPEKVQEVTKDTLLIITNTYLFFIKGFIPEKENIFLEWYQREIEKFVSDLISTKNIIKVVD